MQNIRKRNFLSNSNAGGTGKKKWLQSCGVGQGFWANESLSCCKQCVFLKKFYQLNQVQVYCFPVHEEHTLGMAEVSSGTAKAIAILTFLAGFVCGYKAKEWRIKWTRWRRDRLALKLVETQKKLEIITTSWRIMLVLVAVSHRMSKKTCIIEPAFVRFNLASCISLPQTLLLFLAKIR